MPPTPNPTGRGHQLEGLVLVLIVIAVGAAAGAASFTHVKDWTLDNSPHGTRAWFGWANAIISELVPVACLLTIRRRKRTGAPIRYPLALLITAALLSLAAQLAVAKSGPTGWLLSAVPALAFMALVKLVLVPVKTSTQDNGSADDGSSDAETPATPSVIEPVTTPVPAFTPDVPTHLLPTARYAVANHQQTTGQAITADELAARMSITPDTAGQLLTTLGEPTSTASALPARVNGTPIGGLRP